jgi:hypothetical protein
MISTPIASLSHKQRAVNRAMELRFDEEPADCGCGARWRTCGKPSSSNEPILAFRPCGARGGIRTQRRNVMSRLALVSTAVATTLIATPVLARPLAPPMVMTRSLLASRETPPPLVRWATRTTMGGTMGVSRSSGRCSGWLRRRSQWRRVTIVARLPLHVAFTTTSTVDTRPSAVCKTLSDLA